MPSKRLVVLDEQDYQNLVAKSKLPQPPVVSEPEAAPEAAKPRDPSPGRDPTPEPEPEEPKEPTPEPAPEPAPSPEPPAEAEPETKSALQAVIEELSPTIQQPALRLLKRLSKIEGFGYDSGQVTLDGKPVEGYSLKRFLVATCTKGATNDLPLRLRLFLSKNKVNKFRNPKIILKPKQPWRRFGGSASSTTGRVK